ncbi:MAG: cache domain-containing protein [Methanomassiliicoccales archaeon]
MNKIKMINIVLALLVALVITETGALVVLMNNSSESSDDLEAEKQRAEMAQYLVEISAGIQNELFLMDHATSGAAVELQGKALNDSFARALLNNVTGVSSNIVNVITTDIDGTIVAAEPSRFSNIEGMDIGYQETMRKAFEKGSSAISPLEFVVEGYYAVYMAYPVFDDQGTIVGTVSTLFRPDWMIQNITEAHAIDGLNVMFMQHDGVLLFDPDEDQIGRNTFTDTLYQNFTEIKAIASRMVNESSGSGSYSFEADGEAVRKTVIWTTVGLLGAQWTVAVNRAV